MSSTRTLSDASLIDALEQFEPESWTGRVWRVVRDGRDPLSCSASRGRWDDGTFDVLYTSSSQEGALEEMRFHLGRGQPVIPDIPLYRLFELEISFDALLRIETPEAISNLGVDLNRYGRLPYLSHGNEYVRSQEIASAAEFLDFDGMCVPSARSDNPNLVAFCGSIKADAMSEALDHGPIQNLMT
jgi:hypothetical protein